MKIIDGKKIASRYEEELKEEVRKLGFTLKGVNILIGDDPSSVLYTKIKERKAKELGISFKTLRYSSAGWTEVVRKIEEMNRDPKIQGIMVQLPVPEEFLGEHSVEELLERISPEKDIDGLNWARKARFARKAWPKAREARRVSPFVPAAVRAVLMILDDENILIEGKKAVVLGASDLVGKPIGEEIKKRGGFVTVCNSKTENLKEYTLQADIIVSATGKPGILTGEMVKDGVAVLDVGAEKVNGKLLGDVEFESVYPKASKITPVPGGVGPITVIALFKNMVQCGKGGK